MEKNRKVFYIVFFDGEFFCTTNNWKTHIMYNEFLLHEKFQVYSIPELEE